jgi:hypothetical protein
MAGYQFSLYGSERLKICYYRKVEGIVTQSAKPNANVKRQIKLKGILLFDYELRPSV